MDLFTIQKGERSFDFHQLEELNPDLFSLLHANSWAGKKQKAANFQQSKSTKKRSWSVSIFDW